MEKTKVSSLLIPYRINTESISVYLQKRTKDAEKLPDYFGFWGGAAECGENPEQTLRREMKEEINFVPEYYEYFRKFEFGKKVVDIFILKAGVDFDGQVTVLEGQYGKWLSEQEVANELKLAIEHRTILFELYKFLRTKISLKSATVHN